jgi:GNAT superfamily N-acetyltransferase
MQISIATDEDLDDVRAMLREYVTWLGLDLGYQDFSREFDGLPGAYGPPSGALLIAREEGRTMGMVALRRLDESRCEMKRLYVRPDARGSGLGKRLIDRIVDEARQRGYREMYLDTLPVMSGAQRLYQREGFEDIEPYYTSPVPGTRFMRKRL